MTKQLFYSIKVGAGVEHMCGKGMPEYVRVALLECGYKGKVMGGNAINKLGISWLSMVGKY